MRFANVFFAGNSICELAPFVGVMRWGQGMVQMIIVASSGLDVRNISVQDGLVETIP